MQGNRLGLFLLYDFIQTLTCSRYFVTISESILWKAYVVLVPASEFFLLSEKFYYESKKHNLSSVGKLLVYVTYLHCCSWYSREI